LAHRLSERPRPDRPRLALAEDQPNGKHYYVYEHFFRTQSHRAQAPQARADGEVWLTYRDCFVAASVIVKQ